MSDRERGDGRRHGSSGPQVRRRPSSKESKRGEATAFARIEWARALSNEQMDALLQEALLKTRATSPRTHEVTLLEEVVHELKSRLRRYNEIMGELPQKEEEEEGDGEV